jgi:hypothetical protein
MRFRICCWKMDHDLEDFLNDDGDDNDFVYGQRDA